VKTILHIIRKELLQFRRDPKMFSISFIAPIFQLLVLGYAANLDVTDLPTVVCDLDRSAASRELLRTFSNSGYFELAWEVTRMEDVDPYLETGEASIAVVVPRGFGDRLTAGRPAGLQVIADGSDANSATIGLGYASALTARYSQRVIVQRLERLGRPDAQPARIAPEVRVWYNPELKSRNFMVPGILGLLLLVMTMMLTSLAIVKEKEVGTMEQLVVTPIRPYQLIIGKLAPFTLIGLVDIVLILLVAAFWFNVPVRGSVPLLFGLCVVFLMTTLGLGLLVSTLSRTQQQAMITSAFFVMFPMNFLSGFIFPIENMPELIQYLTYLLPPRYFFVILRGLFLKGVGLEQLWDEVVILSIMGVAILTLSALRFRKKLG